MKKTRVLLMACLLASLTAILCFVVSRRTDHGTAQGAGEAFSATWEGAPMHGKVPDGGAIGGMRGQSAGEQRVASSAKARPYAGGGGVFQVVSVSPQETRVRFSLPEIHLSETEVKGRNYSVVEARGANPLGVEGAPELPVFRCDFTVAQGVKRSLKVLSATVREIPALPPVPSLGLVVRGEEERMPLENPAIYGGNSVFPPEQLAELCEYWLRRVPGVGVSVSPVRYDFARGMLLVADSIEFAFSTDVETADEYACLDSQVDFSTLQLRSFANGELLERVRGEARQPGHILIIVPKDWKSSTFDFVSWKKRLGYKVSVATYPDETGEDVATYISGKYEQDDVSHLILCGDCGDVPPAYTSKHTVEPGVYEPTTDVAYALLSGEDYVPDLFVSRVPSHSAAQLKGILKKFVQYESAPPEDDGWRGKAVFMGSNASATTAPYKGKYDREIMAENYALLQDAGVLPEGCAEIYAQKGVEESTLKNELKAALNNGAAFMEYLGHGHNTNFVTSDYAVSDANSMQNGNAFPFIFAPVCDTGNFAYPSGDCLAEAFFVGAGCTFGVNGAGAVLASTSQTKWNPPIRSVYEFTQVLIDSYSENRLCSIGAVVHQLVNEGAKLAESYISNNDAYYYTKQMHLFGDCSMMPRLRSLREVVVTPSFEDRENLCITVTWEDDEEPVSGAFVVMTDEAGEQVGVVCTDGDGEAHFACIDGTATIFVNDASCRPVSLSVDCSAQEFSYTLPTMYVGLNTAISLVPDGWEVQELEVLCTLPDGLELTTDGMLVGSASIPGDYELRFYCFEKSHGGILLTLSLKVLPGADADENGKVSTPELLEFLDACTYVVEADEARDAAIALWQVSGASGAGRASGEGLRSGEKAHRLEFEVTLNEDVTEDFLENSGAVVKCLEGNHAWIEADEVCVARLKAAKVVMSKVDDKVNPTTNVATRGTAHYPSQAEMLAELRSLVAEYPARCRFSYVGKSVQGREMVALRVSNLPEDGAAPQLLIAAAIHGNERTGMVIALKLARYLAENGGSLLGKAVFYILPSMNPDGCEAVTRYNANRYDLNRGFPDGVVLAPLGTFAEGDAVRMGSREPEVQAFMRWCASHRFSAALHLHTGEKLLCHPYGNVKSTKEERISPDNDLFVSLCTTYAEQNPDISKVINAYDYYRV
ncbi:MAG: succinylglutamate desuccinylase/aspartoacylase family protein, partial [Victivallales bacterium]|nr:succinylglutamate desuccinylase/aspartoacylase family protein [Victivallales bacterium]